MEQFLLNCTEFMLTNSMSSSVLSCTVSCSISFTTLFLMLLWTFQKWSILLHSVHIFPYARHCLGGYVLPQYLHVCFDGMLDCVGPFGFSLWACLATQIWSNSFVSVLVLIVTAWALCASTIFTYDKIFSLVMVSFTLTVVSSFIISPNIYLSLSLWMICSFNCLSRSW